MGRELFEREPVFRAALERCAAALKPLRDTPLQDVLFPKADPGEAAPLHQTEWTQPALFSLNTRWPSSGARSASSPRRCSATASASTSPHASPAPSAWRTDCAWSRRAQLMQRVDEAGGMATLFGDEAAVAPLPSARAA